MTETSIPSAAAEVRPELSIVLLALNEAGNVSLLLRDLRGVLGRLEVEGEILVVDGGSKDGTREAASDGGARVVLQKEKGFGAALREGFAAARGRWVLLMDADLSHPPAVAEVLWEARGRGDVIVASRYVPGAGYDAPWFRRFLSRTLNFFFSRGLALPLHDVSGNFRLYDAKVLEGLRLEGVQFDVLEEVLVKIYMSGGRLAEVPYHYAPRGDGRSKAQVIPFGFRLLRMFFRLWKVRYFSARRASA